MTIGDIDRRFGYTRPRRSGQIEEIRQNRTSEVRPLVRDGHQLEEPERPHHEPAGRHLCRDDVAHRTDVKTVARVVVVGRKLVNIVVT